MDNNLKNSLIIIGVLIVIYFVISPYRSCLRDYDEPSQEEINNDLIFYSQLYKTEKDVKRQRKEWHKERCARTYSW